MKYLSFLFGTFLFFFSFCQSPEPSRTRAHQLQSPSADMHQIDCELKTSQIVGYLDFVHCQSEAGMCTHFLIPEHLKKVRAMPLGSQVKLSGKFSLEGTAAGNQYYYLLDDLRIQKKALHP